MEAQSIVVPDDLYCPISGDLMVNEVYTSYAVDLPFMVEKFHRRLKFPD